VDANDQPAPNGRLVAVLGYSTRRGRELHPICVARLEHAARETRDEDLVVLSGGRSRSLGRAEADAMHDAWPGPSTAVVRESAALTTVENARHVRDVAVAAGVKEVVVVTSRWHSPRAAVLFRRAFRDTGVRVSAAPARTAWSPGVLIREAACMAALPFQLRRLG
jgi:uncharacterized SAM-binding protein YcdF (DUF218 family)